MAPQNDFLRQLPQNARPVTLVEDKHPADYDIVPIPAASSTLLSSVVPWEGQIRIFIQNATGANVYHNNCGSSAADADGPWFANGAQLDRICVNKEIYDRLALYSVAGGDVIVQKFKPISEV